MIAARRCACGIVALALLLACAGREEPPPSFLLVVIDTLRADAVSSYGAVAGTTPTLDRLAASGLRYARAYAQAPWTLPSHATLFTGLLPSRHGVGLRGVWLDDEVVTLAERLREAGYETVGFSENHWVTGAFNVTQGFERFAHRPGMGAGRNRPTVEQLVSRWWRERDASRPFFLFVNVVDPHAPYGAHPDARFLPEDTTPAEARRVRQAPHHYLCRTDASAHALEVLRGLYWSDVAAADARVDTLLGIVGEARPIAIVTSDHGELFGEAGLVGHQFSLHDALLHVPLIVDGLPDADPAVIGTPVQLADLMPSILAWADLPAPAEGVGRVLPIGDGRGDARPILAEYGDPEVLRGASEADAAMLVDQGLKLRRVCGREWPVYGDMRALLRYPLKLVEFDRYPTRLYDLSRDPREERDLTRVDPQRTATLSAELADHMQGIRPMPSGAPTEIPAEILQGLRELGYAGGEETPP